MNRTGMTGGIPEMVGAGTPFSGYSAKTRTNQGIIIVMPPTEGIANKPKAVERAQNAPSNNFLAKTISIAPLKTKAMIQAENVVVSTGTAG